VLESTPNAVHVGSSGYQSTIVANNYFEANTGAYCICMDTLEGPWVVGPNNFNNIQAAHNVLALYTARGVCHDPAWLQACINVQTPEPGTSTYPQLVLNNAATDWYLRVDTQFSAFTREPVGTVVAGPLYVKGSGENSFARSPFDGSPMPVIAESTGTAATFTFPDATLQIPTYGPAPSPLWLVGCIAMRLLSPPPQSTPSPTFTLTLTGANITTTSSSPPQVTPSGTPLPSPIPGYTDFVRTGDWALVTFALAIQGTDATAGTQAVTASLQAAPYASDAPAGLQYELRPPILYVVSDINDARPFFDPFEARPKV
jgi:hypothetical protein